MTVYPDLGASLSFLTVAILQSNEVLTGATKRFEYAEDDDDDVWWPGKKRKVKIDGYFYPMLMHGPAKYCRPILDGNEPFMTQSSAETAAELLLKYVRQLEPCPADRYPSEELLLPFPAEALPELITA